MKHTVRTFSLGLLTATSILGLTYLVEKPLPENSAQMGTGDMIDKIEKEGYHVLAAQEYKALQASTSSDREQQEAKTIKSYVYSLDIEQGDTITDISKKLANARIIEDAEALRQYMKNENYSRYIQIGQVTLDSTMKIQEIADVITSK